MEVKMIQHPIKPIYDEHSKILISGKCGMESGKVDRNVEKRNIMVTVMK